MSNAFSTAPELSRSDFQLYAGLKRKKNRQEQQLFLVEGIKNVRELLHSSYQMVHLVIPPGFNLNHSLPELDPQAPVAVTALHRFQKLCETVSPEGVLAVARFQPEAPDLSGIEGPLVYLDGVSDPGNLGAIFRTLDWFGIPSLFISHDTSDPYNGKTVRSSMGSLFHIRFHRDDSGRSRLRALIAAGFSVYPFTLDGQLNLPRVDFTRRSILVMGSESHGVRPDVLKLADQTVRIPGWGRAESLNVAHAFSIAAYQLRLQVPQHGDGDVPTH